MLGDSRSRTSTLVPAAAARHALAHRDLDSIVCEAGEFAVERSRGEVSSSLGEFLDANERCYGELVEAAAPLCTELVFLDPGLETCLANNLRRPSEPSKCASLEARNAMLTHLQAWVTSYYTRDDAWSLRAHRRIFAARRGAMSVHRGPPPQR